MTHTCEDRGTDCAAEIPVTRRQEARHSFAKDIAGRAIRSKRVGSEKVVMWRGIQRYILVVINLS